MNLRAGALLFLAVTYVLLGAAAYLLFRQNPWWLYPAEILLALLLLFGITTFRRLTRPNELLASGAELLADSDYSSTLRRTGVGELDDVVDVYNRMIEKLREERLRGEEQRGFLEKLLAVAPVGVVTLDFDGRIAEANASARMLLGESAIGRTGDPAPDVLREIGPEGPALVTHDQKRLRLWRGSFLDRGFRRTFFVIEELTAVLRETERAAYDKVIRMTAHEINNSLGAVTSLLESLATFAPQLEAADRAAFEESIDVSRRRLDSLAAFTRAIASVVRLPPPNLRPVNLDELLSDLGILLAPELRQHRIELRVAMRDRPLILQADKNQLEQVLVNILRNAIESIGTSGVIEVEGLRVDERVRLTIRDSGKGIAAESENLLFTPFFSTKQDGRGVGLMLVRDILTRHGAGFTLRNHPDGGAEFALDFPTAAHELPLRP